ncbi:unnamed protein product [Heligmosomoides polygyrus]|uniref:DDE_Tnp_1_7 domain-containing protein n=1 Tax=Heligmosomoides polygyrus TaxID=6339 RepID=A0A3P8DBI0_HELPZ|nr:unnamed protein product [Heligmosomoides polygyrus]
MEGLVGLGGKSEPGTWYRVPSTVAPPLTALLAPYLGYWLQGLRTPSLRSSVIAQRLDRLVLVNAFEEKSSRKAQWNKLSEGSKKDTSTGEPTKEDESLTTYLMSASDALDIAESTESRKPTINKLFNGYKGVMATVRKFSQPIQLKIPKRIFKYYSHSAMINLNDFLLDDRPLNRRSTENPCCRN